MLEGFSIKRRIFPKIFFGWWTVIGSGILNLWVAGYTVYGFAALFKPIASELGFSRAVTSMAAGISRFEGGLEGPIVGWATDRFGPRGVVLFGVSIAGLSLILMYYINSLWAFFLVWGMLLGTGSNISTALPLDTAISNWFVKKRGLALGIKWGMAGLSGAMVLPIIAWLVATQSWRVACLVGGIVLLVGGLPIAWFWLRKHRPEYYGLLPDGATAKENVEETSQTVERGVEYAAEVEEMEFTLRQALRTPEYWLLTIALGSSSIVHPIVSIHSIPFLTDIGISPLKAAGMMAMLVFVGLPFRVMGGFLSDRVKKRHLRLLFVAAYSLQAIGFTVFLLNRTMPMIYLWFIIYGVGSGLVLGTQSPLWARYFGRKAIGSIRGSQALFLVPVAISGPIWAGWVYDTSGSYITVFTVATVLLAVSAVFMILARPPKPPARISDVSQII